ncbi:histidine kinase N-terminal domain-containing protein [Actinomadura graeca]|uniref:Histidine kinase N-terminal domain-containing protein n=1 Tax=Actinomadura graeca TaxID=2750812 RepID=A0ABX8R308_9ACTN|nr:PAS domain-containing sensor histidine kinase [Actinomadura graeca]QXJ24654.1 histidine kinase N-terminal domain-containing protein [Actinomadura graeca]
MPTLTDLVRDHTDLTETDVEWLHALVSDWQLLADLSFADLLLWVPLRSADVLPADAGTGPARRQPVVLDTGAAVPGWVAIAQMRPTTGPTAYPEDLVGRVVRTGRRGLIDVAWRERRIVREGDPEWGSGIPVREESIPVRRGAKILGVIQRSTNLSSARTPSRLELTYLQSASDLAKMISEGRFPVPGEEPNLVRSPRVGDGLMRLDRSGRVSYASPNAQSAYRRLGFPADLVGESLGQVTADLCDTGEPREEALSVVLSGRAPREVEVEAHGSVMQLRTIPLVVGGTRIGAIVLCRDVTELRWRDRELMTKDATIREIHHRVKNNLQTVAALLRLQARRLQIPEGRAALDEAVRRVGSIAIVHETLSHTPDELIDFDDIADRVIMMAGEVSTPETKVTPKRTGNFGVLPAEVATPLAMALTELLQNALEHGLANRFGTLEVAAHRYGDGGPAPDPGGVPVQGEWPAPGGHGPQQGAEGPRTRGPRLVVVVADDGKGLPADFDVESSDSLGLQIVRTLIVGELGGHLDFRPHEGGGTEVVVDVPVDPHHRPGPPRP